MQERGGQAGVPTSRHGEGGRPAWFRALEDAELLFVGLCGTDGTLLDANRVAVEGCGFSRAAQIGRPFWATGWWSGSTAAQEQMRS
ncbi:hypothetical protein SAMN05661080_03245 [Modestobacter sp. DSM 44400]|nr:hypothetical protein SAMN05661080_03245 [Modestobacter sp. DSM 44400]